MYIGRLCTRSIRLYSQKRYVSLHDIRLFSQYPRRYNIHVDVPLFSQDPQRTSPFVIYVSFCIIHVSLTRNLRLFSQKRYDSFRSVRLFFCNIHVSVDTFYMALLTQKVRCSYRPAAHSSTWLLVYMHCIHFSPKKNIHTFKKKKNIIRVVYISKFQHREKNVQYALYTFPYSSTTFFSKKKMYNTHCIRLYAL